MAENNVQLIQRILDGEKEAFSILVQKYQKRIHALAWRKIGDYHIAEEITQDTFLKVYEKLPTLKNPKQFDGWIYVIANRLCINWFQRNKTPVQSIEDTPVEEIEKSFYTHYESEQRKVEATAHYRAIIKKLLAKLPESERTVLTLFYLGEMTAQEISKFLGVSVNTIKSRIRRARNRLKAEEELLITENIGSVQLSTDLTESIMRQVTDIKPSPPVAKPTLPWAAFGTAAVLVMLLLGAMHQYIAHFQKPYNFDALSEPTIEIVESPIHIDIISNPAERKKIGKGVTSSRSEGVGAMVSDADLAANAQENALNSSVVRWTQANGPQGSPQFNIFTTLENNIHAVSSTGIYRLMNDGTTWMNINASVPISTFQSPITEHQGVLYSVNTNDISASTDGGDTWNRFCNRPNGDAVGLIIRGNTQENSIMYLALKDKGVFRSDDVGRKWFPLNNGLIGKRISAVAKVSDSVFIGTNRGLYRLNLGVWNRLPVDPLKTVHSMVVFENNLYVVTGPDFLNPESNTPNKKSRKIFHSTDLGSTWREITPKDKSFIIGPSFKGSTKISAFDKTLLVLGVPAFRSRDGGQTWTNLGFDINLLPSKNTSVLAINENTFYKVGPSGIIRTTDGGDSWHPFTSGMVGTKVQDLVAFNNRLYVYTGTGFFKSTDNGNSWEEINIDYGEFTPTPTNNGNQDINYFTNSKLVISNNVLYGITPQGKELRIFRLRPDDGAFSTVHRIFSPKLWADGEEVIDTNLSDTEKGHMESGGFAVSGKTFYIEYMRKLLKWTPDSIDVIDTGLADTNKHNDELDRGFKLAVSEDVVYVGKRDGRLFQSLDGGNSWRDVTLNIPYSFTRIKDIIFVGSTVYVATDEGVMTSRTGEHWRMLTNSAGVRITMDRFTTYGSSFYGAGDMGVYRLDSHGKWKQISSNIPDKVVSLSASVDKLYIATKQSGIFYTSIEKESPDAGSTAISSLR
ncbi:MAG: sigma-70 family RNA polymerase sigma factor [Candidatus Poribacteria bacterium]|nr:sigma-70 family RNA polymerase sigma factor [Candidatus Poribacteria bacterium]